jgi:putative oxidoreductase
MLKALFETKAGWGQLFLRLGLGTIFFVHGSQKVLGWFGGYGLSATYKAFTVQMGIPAVFAVLAIAAEFLGSIGLFVGLFTRIAAFGIGSVMVTAIYMVHWQNGFFMNWSGSMPAGREGFEFHILAIAMALALVISGGGRLSIDREIAAGMK